MNRRNFIRNGAMFAILALPIPGCLPLLSLVLRGGLIRSFSRVARFGRTPALHTMGRGVALGAHSATIARSSLPNTRIISTDGRVLAKSKPVSDGIALHSNSKKIFFSRATGDGHLHYDVFGSFVGRSAKISSNRINYYENSRRREKSSGFDIISRTGRMVRHFDKDGDEQGSTQIDVSGGVANVSADDGSEAYIEYLFQQKVFMCEAANRQYDEFREIQQRCVAGDTIACSNVKIERLRLNEILKKCR